MCVFGGWGDRAECVVCGNEERSGLVHVFVRCLCQGCLIALFSFNVTCHLPLVLVVVVVFLGWEWCIK